MCLLSRLRAAVWLLELKNLKASGIGKVAAAGESQAPSVHLTWHCDILARLLSDCSERHWQSMGLGIHVVAGGDQTCPLVPPDIPKALSGAHMACRCFECDVGFQHKNWSQDPQRRVLTFV